MRKADTDRVREGISEGCRSGEPDGSLREARERLRRCHAQTHRTTAGNSRKRPPHTGLIDLPYSAALHGWRPVPRASRPSRDALVRPW